MTSLIANSGQQSDPHVTVVIWPWEGPGLAAATRALVDAMALDTPALIGDAPGADAAAALAPGSASIARGATAGETLARAAGPGGDVLLLSREVTISADGLARLRAAAYGDDELLAACVPDDGVPAGAAAAVAEAGRPRLSVPVAGLVWLRGTALELIGGADPTLAHPDCVLLDLAARGLRRGLTTALAADVAAPRGPGGSRCADEERQAIVDVDAGLRAALAQDAARDCDAVRRVWLARRAAAGGLSVTIDARSLSTGVGGTQAYVAALALAVARSRAARVRVLLGAEPSPELAAALDDAGATTVTYEQAIAGVERTDIVHRPQQVFTADDLALLRLVGERIVLTQLDLIAYRSPGYHASAADWGTFRRTTRLAFAAADHVIFCSEHSRSDALSEELVAAARTSLAGIGIDPSQPPGARPAGLGDDRDFLLVLGTDYAHKNRPFALRLVDRLRTAHGFDGRLVLAGPHAEHGSSRSEETAILQRAPELADAVVDLGPVSEPERRWLLSAARAHLCPSSYEGFGLIPLEAGVAGRPCVYAAWSSLAETIDPAAATIVPWDVERSAAATAELLREGPAQARHLELLRAAVDRHRWDVVVTQVHAAYERTMAQRLRSSRPHAYAELEREQLIVDLDASVRDLSRRVSPGFSLIDADGPLLSAEEQRGIIRLATSRRLRGPALAALRAVAPQEPDDPGDAGTDRGPSRT